MSALKQLYKVRAWKPDERMAYQFIVLAASSADAAAKVAAYDPTFDTVSADHEPIPLVQFIE